MDIMSQPDRAEPPPRRHLPPHALGVLTAAAAPLLLGLVVGALALASGGCGDNLEPPATCDVDDVAREAACQRVCKTDTPPTELCPGGEARACLEACVACEPDDNWCPAVAP